MKKVKFVVSPSGNPFNLAYHVGEEAEMNEKQAKDLIDSGFAIDITPVEVAKVTKEASPRTKAKASEKR